mgnify:CR=1 FL=1
MRYILILPVITALGCTPAAKLDQSSTKKNGTRCAALAASYERAKSKKAGGKLFVKKNTKIKKKKILQNYLIT